MENILRIWVYITVLKRMKPQLCFFLKKPSLVNRTLDFASDYKIDINKYIFCDRYSFNTKRKLKEKYYTKEGQNRTIDSIRKLFDENKPDNIHFH